MRLSPNEIAYVAQAAGFTGEDLVTAVAVALAESGGETDALGYIGSDNHDHGLWQISNKWHALTGDGKPGKLLIAGAKWRDPLVNARLAKAVFDETVRMGKASGWMAWAVYDNGTGPYTKHLPAARRAVLAPWAPPTTDVDELATRLKNATKES